MLEQIGEEELYRQQIMRRIAFVSGIRFLFGCLYWQHTFYTYRRGLILRTITAASTVVLLAKNLKKWAAVVPAAAAKRRKHAMRTTKRFAVTPSKNRAQERAQPVGRVSKAMPLTGNTGAVLGWFAVSLEKLKKRRELPKHSQFVDVLSSAVVPVVSARRALHAPRTARLSVSNATTALALLTTSVSRKLLQNQNRRKETATVCVAPSNTKATATATTKTTTVAVTTTAVTAVNKQSRVELSRKITARIVHVWIPSNRVNAPEAVAARITRATVTATMTTTTVVANTMAATAVVHRW